MDHGSEGQVPGSEGQVPDPVVVLYNYDSYQVDQVPVP